MNSRAKGNKQELKVVKELEDKGWLCYRVKGSTNRFQTEVDIFGLFDIYAIMKVKHDTYHRYIQVKSNRPATMKPFKEWWKKYHDFNMVAEQWIWYDKGKSKKWKGWRKIHIQ